MHEVRLIERARMKRAWEKALPPITDEASLEKRRRLIAAIERDEWAFREQVSFVLKENFVFVRFVFSGNPRYTRSENGIITENATGVAREIKK